MKDTTIKSVRFLLIVIVTCLALTGRAQAGDESAIFTSSYLKPNVLIILDNSNSMDQDFYGNAIGAFKTGSRSVEARRALIDIINANITKVKFGVMSYSISSASKYYLHQTNYFISYDKKSYCPNPPQACTDYCKNVTLTCSGTACRDNGSASGADTYKAACQADCQSKNPDFVADYLLTEGREGEQIFPYYAVGTGQRNRYCDLIYPKTLSIPNPTDTTNSIYFKTPGTFYASSNQGTRFCYAYDYDTTDYYRPSETATDKYSGYQTKTGTSDDFNGYSNAAFTKLTFTPTDEDIALGFSDFGKRMHWVYSGQTWFRNSSPGGGYLHVPCAENNETNNNQRTALLAKIATKESDETGYMSCTSTSAPNTCAYIINAGLTPTAGTLENAIKYFKGVSPYNSNPTSPIDGTCQKNFIIYVTDGLPSVNESGATGTADSLMPAVKTKLATLRSIPKRIGSQTYNFEVLTYVLGMGLTEQAKVKLDEMAVEGGTADSNGHAYYADNPSQLSTALEAIFANIEEKTYSFTTSSVSSSRTLAENYLYEASFDPLNNASFWPGHLKKFIIDEAGEVSGVYTGWCNGSGDVAECLKLRTAARTLKTFKAGSLVDFSTVTKTDLAVATDAERDATVTYITGVTNQQRLGDIFHSNPITVGKPSPVYEAYGFDAFRTSQASRVGVVVVGANDGQFHAFQTSDGQESWSFIPPNMLPKLNNIRTTTTHQYLVDGPVTVLDAKSNGNWRTMLFFALGRGGNTTLWSSSASCDGGFSTTYSSTTAPYYCGYYAFDLTTTTTPALLPGWTYPVLKPRAQDAPYLGEPRSRMTVGKVKISGAEKWVGFFGGGYNATNCSGGGGCADPRGKGFFAVDLETGNIFWSYTWGSNPDSTTGMTHSVPAPPGILDADNDGYIDTAYIGDLGGNMWRFKFCSASAVDTCNTTNWEATLLFDAHGGGEGVRPVYSYPTATIDPQGNLWIYWTTGDKSEPTAVSTNEKVLGIKDNNRTTTYTLSGLANVTSATQSCEGENGWYINFTGREKALTDVTVFGGIVYFTTYVPPAGLGGNCGDPGFSNLWALNYGNCNGIFTEGRYTEIGVGIASAPVLSFKPGGKMPVDLYITRSGGGGQAASTIRAPLTPPSFSNRNNMLYWRDMKVQ